MPNLEALDVVRRRHDPTRVEHVGSVGHHEVEVEIVVVGEHDGGVGRPELLGGERDQLDAGRQHPEGDVGVDRPDLRPADFGVFPDPIAQSLKLRVPERGGASQQLVPLGIFPLCQSLRQPGGLAISAMRW